MNSHKVPSTAAGRTPKQLILDMGWVPLSNVLVMDRNLPASALRVYAYLLNRLLPGGGGVCSEFQQHMAEHLELSERTLSRHLKKLCQRKLLLFRKDPSSGSVRYTRGNLEVAYPDASWLREKHDGIWKKRSGK